jgi:hypothetical protein
MYYEIRTYRIKTGALPVYLKLVEEEGIALQKQYLGELVGYFYSEIGPLNQIVHIWAYPSLDEREARRTALAADGLAGICPENPGFVGRNGKQDHESGCLFPVAVGRSIGITTQEKQKHRLLHRR